MKTSKLIAALEELFNVGDIDITVGDTLDILDAAIIKLYTQKLKIDNLRAAAKVARSDIDALLDTVTDLDSQLHPAITPAYLDRQCEFSLNTFGPGARTAGVLDHIRKELVEIEDEPGDFEEWADLVILAFDGALRMGADPEAFLLTIKAKQAKNEQRKWPDWRTMPTDKAIEHDRSAD